MPPGFRRIQARCLTFRLTPAAPWWSNARHGDERTVYEMREGAEGGDEPLGAGLSGGEQGEIAEGGEGARRDAGAGRGRLPGCDGRLRPRAAR